MRDLPRRAMRIIYRRRPMAVYSWQVAELGCGRRDPEVRELVAGPGFRDQAAGLLPASLWRGGRHLMIHRVRRGLARLFVLESQGLLAGYGFTQPWALFSWAGPWLGSPGVILGPYWTDPSFRGRGVYPRLILHTLNVEAERGAERFYICARPDNIPSRKGIERAGFDAGGCYEQRTWLLRLRHRLVPLAHLPQRVDQPDT